MGILLVFLGSFLLYVKSKYVPAFLGRISEMAKAKPAITRWGGYLLFFIAMILLNKSYGFWTGLVIFIITLMFALTLIIVLLPLNKKYAYLLFGMSVAALLTEYFI